MADRDDAGRKQDGGSAGSLDCPSCDGDCIDGPGCLAGLLFIAMFGAAYGVFHVVMRALGRDPRLWDGTGAVITAILIASLGIAGYAWYWMEHHWK